ncbi:MAG: hypothetical protein MMC33_005750 [Icmadophila ericetorum]|nr:hypothetical protein [Icmadophila ericetorum]
MKEGIALVIGGNRGIGFNLVKALRSRGWTVYASVRPQTRADKSDPSCNEQQLEATGARILEIDTLIEATVHQAAKEFGLRRLDVLVNSADNTSGSNLAYRLSKTAINQFSRTLAAELPVQDPPAEGPSSYSALKLDKATTSKICVLSIHPGFIPTKMTNFEGPDDMDECIEGIVEQVEREEGEWKGGNRRSGGYFDWKGEVMDW